MANPKYRYYVTYNAVTIEVYPLFQDNVSIDYNKINNIANFSQEIKGDLVFSGDSYLYFLNIEQTNKCALLSFDIQRECEGVYTSIWTGEFGTVDGTWDIDKCIFTINPIESSIYNCLLTGAEFNVIPEGSFFGGGTIVTAQNTIPSAEFNCCKLEDALNFLMLATCSDATSIISNFFQINPVTVSNYNYITNEVNVYKNMYITPLSNVYRMSDTLLPPVDVAPMEKVSLKDLLDDLKVLFNVDWRVEGTDIRIEHQSYFTASAGLDLTQAQYSKYVSGKNKYSYNREASPRYEIWKMFSSDMVCKITYDNACGVNKLNNNTVEYTTKKLYTDFYRRWYETTKTSRDISGFFLFAVHNGTDMNGWFQNDYLILPRLVLKFHRHDRPQGNGTFTYNQMPVGSDWTKENHGDLFIYSEKYLKKQTELKIKLCCGDTFDANDKITTEIGEALVDTASFNLYTKDLSLQLKYQSNPNNTDIMPSDLSGLQVWYKYATGITFDGSAGTIQWSDQSGNAYHMKQSNAGLRPPTNGSYITFETGKYLSTEGNSFQCFPSKRGTVFIIMKLPTPSDTVSRRVLGTGGGGNNWDISLRDTGDQKKKLYSYSEWVYLPARGHMSLEDSTSFAWGENTICLTLIRNSDTLYTDFLNGKPPFTNTVTIANNQPASAVLVMGYDMVSKYFDFGEVYEVVIYNRALTDIERQKIELYLCKKFHLNMYSIS